MTVSGALSDVPSGVTTLSLIGGAMTVSGALSDVPSGVTYLRLIGGAMTVSGALSDVPSGVTYLRLIGGAMTVSVPTSTWSFAEEGFDYLLLDTDGLTQAEVDNALIGAATVTSWAGAKEVDLSGDNNAAPSATGLAAKATIESNGATVLVNS
jgi:hypothetical protein